jgi:MFS family permease
VNRLRRYADVVCAPGVRRPLIATFAGCLPIGFQSLAVLLEARKALGGFGLSGTVAGAYGVADGAGMALQAWAINRYGPRRVLLGAVVLHVPALICFVLLASNGGKLSALIVAAGLGGLSFPQLNGCMRGLWPQLITDREQRQTAYALSSVLFEASVIAGPLAMSLLLVFGAVGWVLVVGATLAALSAVAFVSSPHIRNWPHKGARSFRESSQQGVSLLVFVAGGQGLTFGLVYVCAVALAVDQGSSAMSGVLRAMISVGALVGSLTYGVIGWKRPLRVRLIYTLGMLAAVTAVCSLATSAIQLTIVLALFGAMLSPVMVISSAILGDISPDESVAGAYSLMLTASIIGGNVGLAMGGASLDRTGPHWTLFISACWTMLLAATTALISARSWNPSQVQRTSESTW